MQRKLLGLMGGPPFMVGLLLIALATLCVCGNAQAQSVTLDHVDGLQGVDTIVAGQEIALHFRINTPDTNYTGINNGFRVYSPDGAEWDNVSGAWSEFITAGMFAQRLVNSWNVTGMGADTIGFAGFVWGTLTGIPAGFDSVAWAMTIGPVDAGFEGKTVCVDSSFYPPYNSWKWIPFRGKPATWVFPAWDGPHCFTVASAASCCAIRGDVDDGGFGPDITDLVYLIDYLAGGPAPPCMEQADVNGSGGDADSADKDYLLAYMFSGGPPPVPCP